MRAFGVVLALVLMSSASAAFGQTICNPAFITIPDHGNADPYPSAIAVAGLPPIVGTVDVTLNGVIHSFPRDLGVVLVAPDGRALLLQDSAGGEPDLLGVTYTMSDSGATQLPEASAWPPGTYRPTNRSTFFHQFPLPGPGTNYANPGPGSGGTATLNGTYAGTGTNGTWRLFVRDFIADDSGVMTGGWCITFTPPPPPPLLNEIKVDPPATDNPFEYIEVSGSAGTALPGFFFVSIDGDRLGPTSNTGIADLVVDLGTVTFGANGLILIKSPAGGHNPPAGATTTIVVDAQLATAGGGIENGTNSFLLVHSPLAPIVEGTDYDLDDDGTLEDLPPGATLVDALGWMDGGFGDIVYGGVTLTQSAGTPDAATRFPTDTTPLSATAWFNGDLAGATNDSIDYNPAAASANFPAGGILTPGFNNQPPVPVELMQFRVE